MKLRRIALALAVVPLLLAPAQALRLLGPGGDARALDASEVGSWGAPFEGGAAAVNLVLLNDGRVLYWSGVEAGDNDNVFFTGVPLNATVRVLSPPYTAADVSTPADPLGAAGDLFCSGQTILPDGRVLAAGGSRWTTLPDDTGIVWGLKDARVYDPQTSAWSRVADMSFGRWYPTLLTDADGVALAASGIDQLTNPITLQQTIERYDESSDDWEQAQYDDNLLPMYARLFVVPSGPLKGDLFYQPTSTLWGPFGEHPLEALWSLQQVADDSTGAWRMLNPAAFGARQHGVTVMLPLDPAEGYKAKLLTFGGTLQRSILATPTAEIADLSTDPPANEIVDNLNHARWHANGVLLPDGTVLAVGGGLYDNVMVHGQPNVGIQQAEIFDPATGEWTEAASMQVERMYHSTALLLPDGRVLAGGHVPLPIPWEAARDNVPTQEQIVETRFEIYSPPYLHRGDRPEILDVREEAKYGQEMTVTTPQAEDVTSAMLIRPGATTHSWDSSQRAIELEILSQSGSQLRLRAPPDGDVAAPGWYMLFINTGTGDETVPSEAEFVHLD